MNIEAIQQEMKEGLTIEETCKKYHLDFLQLCSLCKSTFKRLPVKNKQFPKFITPRGRRFEVVKCINGNHVSFGTYFSLQEAVQVKDELVLCDWKADPLSYLGDMYLNPTDKKFTVQKSNGEETIAFGRYNSLTDARRVRDVLARTGWDKELVPLICREFGIKRVNGD